MIKKTFFKIATACFLTCLISGDSTLRIARNYLHLDRFIPPIIQIGAAVFYIIAVLVYLFIKSRKDSRDPLRAAKLLVFWDGALRYVIAFDLCVFGFGKFFGVQFNTPLALFDNPYNTLSPEQLMWGFFGHFEAFSQIIGALQIIGSVLLIFRRTRLIGIFILMPILLNILLLDCFYLFSVVYYIVIITTGLIYLLLLEYDRLVIFFLKDKSSVPTVSYKNNAWKTGLRIFVLLGPLLLMMKVERQQHFPDGKYEVNSIEINKQTQQKPVTDSVLTKVFFDKNDFVMEYNDYRRRFIGNYKYDKASGQLVVVWRYPRNQHDTLFAKILPGSKPVLIGHMGKQILKINLQRVNNGIK